jgi:myosin heavy subunit
LNHLDKSVYGKARNREKPEFAVRHFAGMTWYTVTGFLSKNQRVIPSAMIDILMSSQNTVFDDIWLTIYLMMCYAAIGANVSKYWRH